MAKNAYAWSVDTLGAQILGEINQERNAKGGTVPDRFLNLIREALRMLWTVHDWRWQHRQGTLTILTTDKGDTGVAVPGDFREMHGGQAKDEDEQDVVAFTESTDKWLMARQEFDSTDDGPPRLICFMRDTTEVNDFVLIAKFVPPVSDADYAFPFIYLPICPLDLEDGLGDGEEPDPAHADYKSDSDVIPMPAAFHEGWRLLATAKCHEVFGNEDSARQAWAAWRHWERQTIAENDETMTTNPDPIVDGYDDVGHLPNLSQPAQPNPFKVLRGIVS